MKCPKCKYVTFDYLDACPRCGKSMSSEKAKLNISSIKPNPPFLLSSLTGDLNESGEELIVSESMKVESEEMTLEREGIYDDGSELDINIDEEPVSASDDVAEIDIGDLGLSDEDKGVEVDFVSDAEDAAKKQEIEKKPKDFDLDLDDVELNLDSEEDEEPKK
jgi:hypothetical protein